MAPENERGSGSKVRDVSVQASGKKNITRLYKKPIDKEQFVVENML
jgi:predicted secreted protein